MGEIVKIRETQTMPNPGGFGWGKYSQVRELGAAEQMPEGAVAAADSDTLTGWVLATSLVQAAAQEPATSVAVPSVSAPVSQGGNE